MNLVEFLLVLAVLVAAVVVISAPLRRAGEGEQEDDAPGAEVAGLEAAREAKYREIREAELDFRTGKLAREDWEAIDAELRAEAVDILRRLDRASGAGPPSQPRGDQTTS